MLSNGPRPYPNNPLKRFCKCGFTFVAASLGKRRARHVTGAALSMLVMSGAIFFHLFTPPGIDRLVDYAGHTDGGALFYSACAVWLSSAIVIVVKLYKSKTLAFEAAAQPVL